MNIANIQVEPCTMSLDGVDIGFTDGDIEITVEETGVEVTAHQEGTNVLDMIRTGKKCEIAVTLKETSAAQVKTLIEKGGDSDTGVAEVQTITTVADVAASLNNKVFFLTGKNATTKVVTSYAFYISVAGGGTAPSIPGFTDVAVAILSGDSANAVADAVASAIDALDEFAAPNPGANIVTVTHAQTGAVTAGDAGNSGFAFAVPTPGVSTLTGWGKTKDFFGMLADSKKLVLHPVTKAAIDLTADFAAWKAYPIIGSIVQSGENPKTVSVTFKIFPDASKPDGLRLFAIGDHT